MNEINSSKKYNEQLFFRAGGGFADHKNCWSKMCRKPVQKLSKASPKPIETIL